MLELRSVTKRYGGQAALDGISLSVAEGANLSLLGPIRAGNSTPLRVLACFEAPDVGRVTLNGRALNAMPAHGFDRVSACWMSRSARSTPTAASA
jgi:ABC-type Fe3+/spermidine/putrescine transport system ATPase subunit